MDAILTGAREMAFTVIGYLPLALIFPYMGYILLIYCGYCIIPCLILKNRSSMTMVGYLGALIAVASVPALWGNSFVPVSGSINDQDLIASSDPSVNLLLAHVVLLSSMFVVHILYNSLHGKFGDRILLLATIMVIIDAIATGTGALLWIHQSFVNIIFILMCHYTRKAGYNSLNMMEDIKKQPNGGDYDKSYASRHRKMEETILLIPFRRPA